MQKLTEAGQTFFAAEAIENADSLSCFALDLSGYPSVAARNTVYK